MTDPLLTDSDGDGTDDGDADADSDGLTNAVEMIRGTKPIDPDSDDDSLEDGEEVNTYRTDPLKADNDGDGAEDAAEIRFGFDPLVRNDSFDATAEAEGKVTATARLTVNGEQLNTLSVKADDNPTLFPDDMPGYIGEAYDFYVDGTFDKATVSFEFDKSLLADPQFDPVIYYFNEDEQELEELDTVVLGNTASTTVTHFSTYILLNRKKFNDTINSFLTDTWETGDYKSVETVFVIDDSGSMTYNDREYDRLQVAKELADGLPESGKAGVVSFSDSTHIYTDKLTSDKNEVKRYLDRKFFSSYGGTYMYSAVDSAMNLFSDDSDDTLRLEIILTDGEAFDTGMHSSVIQKAKQKNVKLYTVGLGSSESYFARYLEPLAEETGGEFYVAAKAAGLKSVYESIGKSIDLSVDSDGDGIPDYYEDNLVAFNGKRIIADKNNPDTDGDGLTDGEEVEIRVKQYGKKAIVFGRYHSNPRSGDSDGDGLYDGEPRYINKNGKTIKAAPKDMEPLKMNGHRRFWDAHVKSQQEGITTDYSVSPTKGEIKDEINRDIKRLLKTTNDKKKQDKIKKAWKMLVDSAAGLFDSKGGNVYGKKKTRNVVKNSMNLSRRYLSAQTMADVGAYILCFKLDVDHKAYHSSDKNWQKYFGYNSLYDMVFDAATDMNTQRVTFKSGGESYALWMWKGDYLNLNSGAEIGLYSSPVGSGDKIHYAKIKAVDMNLSLYKYDTYSIQTIVNWYPDDPQWWITGFSGARKEFRHPRAKRLFVIGRVKLGKLKNGFISSLESTKDNKKLQNI